MENKLRENAIKKYKANKLPAWELGIISGVVLGAVMLSNIFTGGISFLLIPFVLYPFLYAAQIEYLGIHLNRPVTFKDFFFRFKSFFSPNNRGTFGIIRSLLFALLFEFIFTMIACVIFVFVLKGINADYYELLINNSYTIFTSSSYQEVIDLIGEELYIIICYALYIVQMIASMVSAIVFIFLTTRNSMSMYFRMAMANSNPMFVEQVCSQTMKRNKKEINKDYFSLNFPIFIIIILSFIVTGIIGWFHYLDSSTMGIIAISASLLLMSFFFPFYFANTETLYEKYHHCYQQTTKDVAHSMQEMIENRIQVSEEEKKRMMSSLDELDKLGKDDKSEDKEDDPKE